MADTKPNLERLRKARERYVESHLSRLDDSVERDVFIRSRGRRPFGAVYLRGGRSESANDVIRNERNADQSELLAAIDEVLASGGAGRHDR